MRKICVSFFLSSILFVILSLHFVKMQNNFLQNAEYQISASEKPLFTISANDLKQFTKIAKSFLEKTKYEFFNSAIEHHINTLLLVDKNPSQLAFSFSVFLKNGFDFILYIPFNNLKLNFAEISFLKKAKKQVLKISNDGLNSISTSNQSIFLITKNNIIYLSSNYQLLNECLNSKSLNNQKVSTFAQNGNFSIVINKSILEKLIKHKYLSPRICKVFGSIPEIISADLLFFTKGVYLKTTLSNDLLKILNIYPYKGACKFLDINFDYSTMSNFLSYYITQSDNNEQNPSSLDITKFISKKIAYTREDQEYLYFLQSEEPEKLKNILLSEGVIDLNKKNFKYFRDQKNIFYLKSQGLNSQIFDNFLDPVVFKSICFNNKTIVLSTSNSLLEAYVSSLNSSKSKKLFVQNNAYFSYYINNCLLYKKVLKSDLFNYVDLSKSMTVELSFYSENKSFIEIIIDF